MFKAVVEHALLYRALTFLVFRYRIQLVIQRVGVSQDVSNIIANNLSHRDQAPSPPHFSGQVTGPQMFLNPGSATAVFQIVNR